MLQKPELHFDIKTTPTWEFLGDSSVLIIHTRIVEEMLNISLSETQWCQASLPTRFGGLGVRRLQNCGPIAFLTSSYGAFFLAWSTISCRIPFAKEAHGV